MDLNFDARTDPVTGYVALSRVKRAQDILILQPFPVVTLNTTDPTQSPPSPRIPPIMTTIR